MDFNRIQIRINTDIVFMVRASGFKNEINRLNCFSQ